MIASFSSARSMKPCHASSKITVQSKRSGRTARIVITLLLSIFWTAPRVGLADDPELGSDVAQSAKPTSQVDPQETTLFNGQDLKGWRVVEKHDFQRHGPVEVQDGVMLLGEGSPLTGVSCTAKIPRDNYELTFDAKRTAGMDFFCGLTFPVAQSHCTLILGGWGGGLTGLSNVDGYAASENETTEYTDFKMDQWYRVRLRVTPGKIQAWIDDEEIVSLEREGRKFSIWWEQEPVRPLGIATYHTSGAIRDIDLRRLDSSPSVPAKQP